MLPLGGGGEARVHPAPRHSGCPAPRGLFFGPAPSPAYAAPPLPMQLGGGRVGSPQRGCVLELLDSRLRPSEQSRRNRAVSVSVWTQGLRGTNRPGCLGMAAGQASPWRGLGWQAPLEAGQPHLVGIGFDTCFQTWSQPLTLRWAGAAAPVDAVCKGSKSAQEEPGRGPPTWPGRLP